MVNKWELFANSNSILRMAIVHLAKKIVINVPHKAFVFYVMMDFTIIKILIHVVFVVLCKTCIYSNEYENFECISCPE